ncbi:MAG TPA: hypothetical protein VND98_02580 [Solirubrobacterales bacterium]|nr:hypothetical protein [Solirubrobacterales bacterium]
MSRALHARPRLRRLRAGGEGGFTLIELLIASVMSIILLGGIGTVLIGALRAEPRVSQAAAKVQSARTVLERMTRELRQGFKVYGSPSTSQVSFETYERHTSCGAATMLSSSAESIPCEVTYSCAEVTCTRLEAAPGVNTGTAERILTGISNASSVFSYSPSMANPTYVGVSLSLAGTGTSGGTLTISDGAALSGLTLGD